MHPIVRQIALGVFAVLILGVTAFSAHAGPTATVTPPYPASAVQPTSASITANGGAPMACTIATNADGSVTPTCDLSSLPVPGNYSLILTVGNLAACTAPDASGTVTCYGGGVSASAPQNLVLVKSSASTTVVFKITP